MAVLSAIGLYALRQDRHLAEQEAREHAEMIADDLVARIANQLRAPRRDFSTPRPDADAMRDFSLLGQGVPPAAIPLQTLPPEPSVLLQSIDSNEQESAFLLDDTGRLIFPAPYSTAVIPKPFDLTELNDEQRRLWQLGQSAYLAEDQPSITADALAQFLATDPPDPFPASAHYSLALLAHKQGELQKALGILRKVYGAYPNAILESGLPLQPLVQMKTIQISIGNTNVFFVDWPWSPGTLYSNLVFHPTALTPHFLTMMADLGRARGFPQPFGETWHKIWENHEQARRLHQRVSQLWHLEHGETSRQETRTGRNEEVHFSLAERSDIPLNFWVNAGESWLAARVAFGGTNHVIFCRSEEKVRQIVQSVLSQAHKVPNYFAIVVEVAGRSIQAATNTAATVAVSSGPLGGLQQPVTMKKDQASLRTARDGLKVSVHLLHPDLLYARQRQRSFWFGTLLAVSSLTAVAGFVTARRAFYRQLRLNELKSNFVSSVSHELRTPIASVRLMAEGLESGRIKDDQKKQNYFKFIVQECRRLTSLIENVLDFSRIEQGRKEYELEPTDLAALVQQTVKTMGTYAAERGVVLALTMNDDGKPLTPSRSPSDEERVSGGALTATAQDASSCRPVLTFQPILDGRAIQQALVNLIDNAIKHSPKSSTVTIGVDLPSTSAADASRITHHASRITHHASASGSKTTARAFHPRNTSASSSDFIESDRSCGGKRKESALDSAL
jgi:signal transduction histidine kinase